MNHRKPHNARWVVVSVNKPVMLRRSDDETWLLNPLRRYILNADVTSDLADHIETMSDLQASSYYRPLHSASKVRLAGSSLLIERYRDRGIGDLLFITGPLAYLHHMTGGDIKPYLYAYADRGSVLNNSQLIVHNNPLVGPLLYDDLPFYNFHVFIDTVTEYCEEPDQYNVYDSIYSSLGFDPGSIDACFKRPFASLLPSEVNQIDNFFYWVFTSSSSRIDLRKTGYYVVAPFSNSNLRTARYQMWLEAIDMLAVKRPVLVVGALHERMPASDMTAGQFVNILDSAPNLVPSGRVINLIGKTRVRDLMQLIYKANCVASMDSAPLYIAEALDIPCVSIWGSHDPGVRIGYDKRYMDLAIWEQKVCPHSPCFAWQGFPENKCPQGARQSVCTCVEVVTAKEIVKRFEMVEAEAPRTFKAAAPQSTIAK
jgi:hypothetical protein